MINIVLVGYGYWAPNLLRVSSNNKKIKVVGILDIDKKKKNKVPKSFKFFNCYNKLLNEVVFDAVIIATPVIDHYQTALFFLNKNKHVFIEKPMAKTSLECRNLIKVSTKKKLVLMVGHLYLYNSYIQEIKRIIRGKQCGKLLYIYCNRLNLGRVQADINVLWSLAPHDISILNYFLEMQPIKIDAHGYCSLRKNIEDLVQVSLQYKNNINCFLNFSWHDPQKIRQIKLIFTKKMIVFDDVQENKKLEIIDISGSRVDDFMRSPNSFEEFQFNSKNKVSRFIKLSKEEPLQKEVNEFFDCILKNKKPLTDGYNGLDTVKIIEKIDKKMKKR